jgi:hypothetical protein
LALRKRCTMRRLRRHSAQRDTRAARSEIDGGMEP